MREFLVALNAGFTSIIEKGLGPEKSGSTSRVRKFKDVWGSLENNNRHEGLHRNIESVTEAKGAQWYRFMFE